MENKKSKHGLDKYIAQLQANVGNVDKINELLDNQELLLAYLKQIGVNPKWLDKVAVVEITKAKIRMILQRADAIIDDKGITYGETALLVKDDELYLAYQENYKQNIKIAPSKLKVIISDGGRIQEQASDFCVYTEDTGSNIIEKVIDEHGVVIIESNNKASINTNTGLRTLSWINDLSRDKGPDVIEKKAGTNVIITNHLRDFANPITCNPIARGDILELMNKYPLYKKWIKESGINWQELITNAKINQSKQYALYSAFMNAEVEDSSKKANNFLERERRLEGFFRYINSNRLLNHAFTKAIESKMQKGDDDSKEQCENIMRKFRIIQAGKSIVGNASVPQIEKYGALDEINELVLKRTSFKKRLEDVHDFSKWHQEQQLEFLYERGKILQGLIDKREIIKGYENAYHKQKDELKFIKQVLPKVPLLGRKFKNDIEAEEK